MFLNPREDKFQTWISRRLMCSQQPSTLWSLSYDRQLGSFAEPGTNGALELYGPASGKNLF